MFKKLKVSFIVLFSILSISFSQDDFSLSFDGVDDYVDFGDSEFYGLTESSSMTIMFNLKVNDFGGMILRKFENFETDNNNFYRKNELIFSLLLMKMVLFRYQVKILVLLI